MRGRQRHLSPAAAADYVGIDNGIGRMQIIWYGHSAFRLDFAGQTVLLDPFFTGHPAFVSDSAAAIDGIGHIVLTHGRSGHVGNALDIAESNGATIRPSLRRHHQGSRRADRVPPGRRRHFFQYGADRRDPSAHAIAMVPIGERFTMSPSAAALAVKRFLKLEAVIPCHYGSFPIIEANADKFVATMKGHETKVLVPEKGKPIRV